MNALVEKLRDAVEAKDAEIERLTREREQILLEVFGGEDAPGYAASRGLQDVQNQMEWWRLTLVHEQDRIEALEAALREARRWIADELHVLLVSSCLLDKETLEPIRESLGDDASEEVTGREATLAKIDALLNGAKP